MVCADDVNILDESVGIIKKNTGALVVASKENGLEVNVDKSKYMVMSGDQNAGRSHNNIQVNTDNSSFERVDSSSIWEQLKKSKFYSGRNCEQFEFRECLLSFDLSFFNFLSKNIKI